jgi:hypothetical protein
VGGGEKDVKEYRCDGEWWVDVCIWCSQKRSKWCNEEVDLMSNER